MSNECSPNFALSGLRFPAIITAIIAVCVLVELVLVASDLRIGLQVGLRGKAYQYGGLWAGLLYDCLLYTSPSPRDRQKSRMPSSA